MIIGFKRYEYYFNSTKQKAIQLDSFLF